MFLCPMHSFFTLLYCSRFNIKHKLRYYYYYYCHYYSRISYSIEPFAYTNPSERGSFCYVIRRRNIARENTFRLPNAWQQAKTYTIRTTDFKLDSCTLAISCLTNISSKMRFQKFNNHPSCPYVYIHRYILLICVHVEEVVFYGIRKEFRANQLLSICLAIMRSIWKKRYYDHTYISFWIRKCLDIYKTYEEIHWYVFLLFSLSCSIVYFHSFHLLFFFFDKIGCDCKYHVKRNDSAWNQYIKKG
jgi:hypothetical protein